MIILADAHLPALNEAFPDGFDIITYESNQELTANINSADILICRSTLNVNQQLLENTNIQVVASATSGLNHIDTSYLTKRKIPLFSAKGANANAVTDWALSVHAHIKSMLSGNTIGIIGLGHVGSRLFKQLIKFNHDILTCDPFLYGNPNFNHVPLQQLTNCDAIYIHANLHKDQPFPSEQMINSSFLQSLNPNCFIVNASRGGIVNEKNLIESSFLNNYCTDVYENEPNINHQILNHAYICTPHIAGHTVEAKINAVFLVSEAIHCFYQKTAPKFKLKNQETHLDLSNQYWKNTVLTNYDPMIETSALKNANDKMAAFLSLRKAHLRYGLITD